MKEVKASGCGRENDLIDLLYGELAEVEVQAFQRHARNCPSCNAELSELRQVRKSVGTWRHEALGAVSFPKAESAVAGAGQQRPSALAAVREFLNLAPLWMKGAVAFSSIVFCLLAGLAIMRLVEGPRVVVVKEPNNAHSETELNARVERRVQQELQRLKSSPQTPQTAGVENVPDRAPARRLQNRGAVALTAPSQKARRPLSRMEREQLAADLRLTPSPNDTDLDLLDDRINQ